MPKRKPNLSPEKQKALAAEAVKRMDDVRQAMASPEVREDYLDFIINFDICEVGYKTLLKSYLKSQGRSPAADNLTINPNQVPYPRCQGAPPKQRVLPGLPGLEGRWPPTANFFRAAAKPPRTSQDRRRGGASHSNEMHRRFMRDGRILNCRTGVEADARCPTGIPTKIDKGQGRTALGPSMPIDNALLI